VTSICSPATGGHKLCAMDHCGWSGICFRGLKQSLYHFFCRSHALWSTSAR